MSRLVLDSTFLIDHLRGLPEAVDRLARMVSDGEEPIVNEIVVCEVAAGLRRTDVPQLVALLEPIEFVQPGPDAAMLAGRWRQEARATGSALSLADALIAAAAHGMDAAVLTRNVRHFALTPVRVEPY